MKGETYEEFVEKFKQKKTTDDCYTPPTIYEIVKEWVCREYGIDPAKIVRPFYPGGDYQAFDYSGGAVVVDNPPFSILSEICSWYIKHKIQFFLFAPSLTCFTARKNFKQMNHIITSCEIVYENGACVKTSFVNNFGDGIVAQTAPKLSKMIDEESKRLARKDKKELPKYSYPDYIVTAALMQRYCRYGIEWKIEAKDCVQVAALDAQKQTKKAIFGTGLLLSERAAAERAAAERAAAIIWPLSDRERALVKSLGRKEPAPPGGAGYYYLTEEGE